MKLRITFLMVYDFEIKQKRHVTFVLLYTSSNPPHLIRYLPQLHYGLFRKENRNDFVEKKMFVKFSICVEFSIFLTTGPQAFVNFISAGRICRPGNTFSHQFAIIKKCCECYLIFYQLLFLTFFL